MESWKPHHVKLDSYVQLGSYYCSSNVSKWAAGAFHCLVVLWISFSFSCLCPEQVLEILVATFNFLFSSLDSSVWFRVKLKPLPTWLVLKTFCRCCLCFMSCSYRPSVMNLPRTPHMFRTTWQVNVFLGLYVTLEMLSTEHVKSIALIFIHT